VIELIKEAVVKGARKDPACEVLNLSIRTLQRWVKTPDVGDQRKGSHKQSHRLSEEEINQVLKVINSTEYMDLPACQIVPRLADRGIYLCSESSMYRIMRRRNLLKHRFRSVPPRRLKTDLKHIAEKSNEIWSWDITYLRSPIRGKYFYLYLVEDIYSRKAIGWRVENQENDLISSQLIQECLRTENVPGSQIRLHADNGRAMKGSIILATLQRLGVIPSFSRPKVSNDNPHIEALFKTVKYRPEYPYKPFKDLEEARDWMESFFTWYNNHHLHSRLNYVTPNDRHHGIDNVILANRVSVYQKAKLQNPSRWSRVIKNWNKESIATLNPHGVRRA
jgi:putative transposase